MQSPLCTRQLHEPIESPRRGIWRSTLASDPFHPLLSAVPVGAQPVVENPDLRQPAVTFESFGAKIATVESLAQHGRLWLVVMLDRSIASQYEQLNWFDENLVPLGDTDVDGIAVRLYDLGEPGDYRHLRGLSGPRAPEIPLGLTILIFRPMSGWEGQDLLGHNGCPGHRPTTSLE